MVCEYYRNKEGDWQWEKISICRIFGIEKSFFEFQIVFGKHKGMFYIALGDKTCLALSNVSCSEFGSLLSPKIK